MNYWKFSEKFIKIHQTSKLGIYKEESRETTKDGDILIKLESHGFVNILWLEPAEQDIYKKAMEAFCQTICGEKCSRAFRSCSDRVEFIKNLKK